MNLEQFLETYASGDNAGRLVPVEIEDMRENGDPHPMVLVHYGKFTAILSLMGLTDHLCIDVHAFVDGDDATAGVFGISKGYRSKLIRESDKGPMTKSHGWTSADVVVVMVGNQTKEATNE